MDTVRFSKMDHQAIKKNILYICTPTSIHDQKWISFFALQKEKYSVYITYEKTNPIDEKTIKRLKQDQIHLLSPLDSFSVKHPFKTIKSIIKLKKIIKTYRIDITHILFATPHALWINFISTPAIITTRGSDILMVIPELLRAKKLKKIYFNLLYVFFKKAFQKAKKISCTSFSQSEKVKELFQINDPLVIRTGVDVRKISEAKDKQKLNKEIVDKKYIFSPRFFSPIYNIELQIDAINYLSKEIIDEYTFVFIKGINYDEKYTYKLLLKLEQLKKEVNLSYIVENYLEQETLWTYFNYSSLSILTPLSDGTPNSGLEAMAARCPLIIPNLNYDKAIFENSCLVLKENSAAELANLITSAIENYPTTLLDNAFEKVTKYGDRTTEMQKLQLLYQNI